MFDGQSQSNWVTITRAELLSRTVNQDVTWNWVRWGAWVKGSCRASTFHDGLQFLENTATRNCGQLVQSHFVVGHWFEVWWRVIPSDAHTIAETRSGDIDMEQLHL